MKGKSVCFTGHRKISKNQITFVRRRTKEEVFKCIDNGYEIFYTGGALGFDIIATQIVLDAKKFYPHVKLRLILPCINQTDNRKQENIDEYNKIIAQADSVEYISQEYQKGCMHERNIIMVDRSSLCIAYLKHKNSGTFYTVTYAADNLVDIINIHDMN